MLFESAAIPSEMEAELTQRQMRKGKVTRLDGTIFETNHRNISVIGMNKDDNGLALC
jgi:hypothetical protein